MPILGNATTGMGNVPTAGSVRGGGGASSGLGTMLKFSVLIADAEIPFPRYMDDAVSAGIGSTVALRYPTSARTFTRLRVSVPQGLGDAGLTVTLYKNLVATAMTVTIPALAPAGTVAADTAHTVSFAANDTFDLRVDPESSGSGESSWIVTATLEGPGGGGSGGGGGVVESVTGAAPGIVGGTATNPIINAQFGSDTTVALPNAASALVDALNLALTLVDDTPGAASSKWLIRLIFGDAFFDALSLDMDAGIMGVLNRIQFLYDTDTEIHVSSPNTITFKVGGVDMVAMNTSAGLVLSVAAGAKVNWGGTSAQLRYDAITGNIFLEGSDSPDAGNQALARSGAVADGAIRGFPTIPTCPGTPAGNVTTIPTGHAALVIGNTSTTPTLYFQLAGSGTWTAA